MVNLDVAAFSRVRLQTATDTFEGLFMPKEGTTVVIKLDSGYNVGIFPEHITHLTVLNPPEEKSERKDMGAKRNEALPDISILHTGGTVASRIDYTTGAADTHFRVSDLISLMPEIQEIANISGTQVASMWSEDMRFGHINNIAKEVFKQYLEQKTTRFIVTTGTDFLHYLSAGLSFALKDLPVSVVVLGAQRSSDRSGSDAVMNFLCAARFLAKKTFHGVVVCMHDSMSDDTCAILPGTNIKKMHSTRRDTFRAINTTPLAMVGYPQGDITVMGRLRTVTSKTEKLCLFKEDLKVGLVYSHPQFYPEELLAYKKFDGLVIAGSGIGLFPINTTDTFTKVHEKNAVVLTELAASMPVAMALQTVYGRVTMNVYAPGRKLQDMGIIGTQLNMIAETAFMKLAWLLSNYNRKEIANLYYTDFVGELPENNTADVFLA